MSFILSVCLWELLKLLSQRHHSRPSLKMLRGRRNFHWHGASVWTSVFQLRLQTAHWLGLRCFSLPHWPRRDWLTESAFCTMIGYRFFLINGHKPIITQTDYYLHRCARDKTLANPTADGVPPANQLTGDEDKNNTRKMLRTSLWRQASSWTVNKCFI